MYDQNPTQYGDQHIAYNEFSNASRVEVDRIGPASVADARAKANITKLRVYVEGNMTR